MNLIELSEQIPTKLDAVKYFEEVRWGDAPHCAYCGSTNLSKRTRDYRFKCYDCNKTSSVTVGTVLQNTNIKLKTWLTAFAIIGNAKKGISARQLKRDLGVSHPTAWKMYHKIRDIMSIENDNIAPLEYVIEADTKQVKENTRECQSLSKGKQKGIPELDEEIRNYNKKGFKFKKRGVYQKPCRITKQKTGEGASEKKIAGVVQRDGNVVAHVITTTSFTDLKKVINKVVKKSKKETILLTDSARSMKKFKGIMNSIAINHFKMYSYRGLNTNTIESFWAIIERQIVGQHHHVDLKYLEKYVAEAVFKFNNRKEDDMFETLLQNSMLEKTKIKSIRKRVNQKEKPKNKECKKKLRKAA